MTRIILLICAWVAFANIVNLKRGDREAQDDTVYAAVAVESARNYCTDTEIDLEAFRRFLDEAGIGHAEVYQHRRSTRLGARIQLLKTHRRTDLTAECKRIWVSYGPESSPFALLRPKQGAQILSSRPHNVRMERIIRTLVVWYDTWTPGKIEMTRDAVYARFGRSSRKRQQIWPG